MSARQIRLAAVATGAALLLAACGAGSDGGDAETTGGSEPAAGGDFDLIQDGALTACSEVPYVPFEFEDADAPSGYSGFDIDLLQAIADNLGLELVVADVSFDALQSGTTLVAGQCDIGASAITITDARKANIDFTDGYYDSLQSLLVPADSDITGIADLAGRTVAVQQGTTGKAYAEENAPEAKLVDYPGDGEMWPALQAGQVEAILQDWPVNREHEVADPNYKIVEQFETDEQYGFAFAKGEKTALREAVNAELQTLRDDGTYDEIYSSYFTADGS
ncbi:amino acid ABC transporter substrate-binding protein [Georgenia yuyongxinii]|uniref:Amino acid ABC transporter substrate-binding protein n=1 Tax=Georgenia yuyongxinii TaxID=2589797 RepID=A0A5B8C637_9MICO|nr:ABC transporter substrate-binding protein [Georgenia yuyongxinii]QDC23446.1 amino acid ABC transporter substrate-binding protein [Georgenia yuyongxinii]